MRNWAIPVVAVLLIAVAAVGYWGYNQSNEMQRLEVAVANNYNQAFYGLLDSMEDVQVKLAKSTVANTLEQNVLNLSDVWQSAERAQANLGRLPLAQGTVMRTEQFLAQTGDYAFSLMRKNAMGVMLTDEDKNKLEDLKEEAGTLGKALSAIQGEVNNGKLSWAEMHRTANPTLRRTSKKINDGGFGEVEKQMSEFPTLIYDGPFSDHIMQQKPKGVTGAEISAEQAEQKALAFVPKKTAPDNPEAVKVGEVKGRIPAYSIDIKDRDNQNNEGRSTISMDISKQGGHVIEMFFNRDIGEVKITIEEAVAQAKDFLEARGFKNMIPTYVQYPDHIAVIPFAYMENDIITYPDMIKVKVALDNGEILGFDALQYLMSHHERELPEPKISQEEARQAVNPSINIIDSNLAVIPLDSGKEAFCWEFKGQSKNGEPYAFYVDAVTGDVVKILKIIDTENGQETM